MKAIIIGVILASIVSVSTSALAVGSVPYKTIVNVGVAHPTQTLTAVQATPFSSASASSANILQ